MQRAQRATHEIYAIEKKERYTARSHGEVRVAIRVVGFG